MKSQYGNWKKGKPKKVKKGKRPAHKAFIASLPCVVCSKSPVECAHLRYADAAAGKTESGMGRKPDDKWITPLCSEHHRTGPGAQHTTNEREWWFAHSIDPVKLCEDLWAVSGDYDAAIRLIREAKA